jgi:hypothetical protein
MAHPPELRTQRKKAESEQVFLVHTIVLFFLAF